MQEDMDANQSTKKKRKAAASTHVGANEGRVLRPRVKNDEDHVDPEHQPSKEITPDLHDEVSTEKGGRKITQKEFYELDSTAFSFVVNTSHLKWKGWKADLKKYKFDDALTDAQLMKKRDERISETDWKKLIKYWRSLEFEYRSAIAKQNRANAVPHTSSSKSHARVSKEMAVKLGQQPRRDQVYIETHHSK